MPVGVGSNMPQDGAAGGSAQQNNPFTPKGQWGFWSGLLKTIGSLAPKGSPLADIGKGFGKIAPVISIGVDIATDPDPDYVRKVESSLIAGGIKLIPYVGPVMMVDGIVQGGGEIVHAGEHFWNNLIASSPAVHSGMDTATDQLNNVWSRAKLSPIIKDFSRGAADYINGGNNYPALINDVMKQPSISSFNNLANGINDASAHLMIPGYGLGQMISDANYRSTLFEDGKAVLIDAANFGVAINDLPQALVKNDLVNFIGAGTWGASNLPYLPDDVKNTIKDASAHYIDQINQTKTIYDYALDFLPKQRDY
jgi:hypothetical protein